MELLSLNMQLFHAICGACIFGVGNIPPALLYFSIFCAKYLVYIIPLHIICLSLGGGCKNLYFKFNSIAVPLVLALALAIFISLLIGYIFYEPRPLMIEPNLALLAHRNSSSFPSNHSIVFSVYIFFLIGNYKELNYIKVILPLAMMFMILTCWARVFTAIHYPIDIIGGNLIGAISWLLIDKLYKKVG